MNRGKSIMKVSIYKSGIITCVILMLASYASAVNTNWKAGTGNWSVVTNWTSGEPVSYSDNAFIDNGGTVQITSAEVCRYLYQGYTSGTSGSIEMSGGSLSTYIEYIGFHGTGAFTQSDGVNTMSDYLYLGRYSDATGIYAMSGGTLTVNKDFYTGYQGIGTFKVTGGDADITVVGNYSVGTYGTLISEIDAGGISLIDVAGAASFVYGTWNIVDLGNAPLGTFNVIEADGGIGTYEFDVNLPNTTDWSWGITDTAGTDTLWVQHVPEPCSLLLLGLGGFVLRRRRQP